MGYQPKSAFRIASRLHQYGFEQAKRLYDEMCGNLSDDNQNLKITQGILVVYDALKTEVEGRPEGLVGVLNEVDPSLGKGFSRLPEQGLVANYLLDVLFSRPIYFEMEGEGVERDVVRVFGRKRKPFVYGKGFRENEMDNTDKVLKILRRSSPFADRDAKLSYLHCIGDLTEELNTNFAEEFQQFVEAERDFFSEDTETRLYAMSDLFRHDFSNANLLRYRTICGTENITPNLKILALRANDDRDYEREIRLPIIDPNLTDEMNYYVDLAADEGKSQELIQLYSPFSDVVFDEEHIKLMGPYYLDQFRRFGSDPQTFVTEMIFGVLSTDGVEAARKVADRLK